MISKNQRNYLLIFGLAVFSRVFYIMLAYVSSQLFKPYDKSTLMVDNDSIFKHLLAWDAIHFLHIADHGYTYEHSIPFFPLLPCIARVFPLANNFTSAIIINNTAFVISALLLYKITLRMYTAQFALISALFFIFQPASIIHSSFYSEPLFGLLFLVGFYYILTHRMLKASIIFGIASLGRSNTVMLILFFRTLYFPIVVFPLALYQFYNMLLIMRIKTQFFLFVPYSYIQDVYWNQGFLRFIRPWNAHNMIVGVFGIGYAIVILRDYFREIGLKHQALGGREAAQELVPEATTKKHAALDRSGLKPEGRPSALTLVSRLRQICRSYFRQALKLDTATVWGWLWDPFNASANTLVQKLAWILTMQVITLVFFIHWNISFRFICFNPLLYWGTASMAMKHHSCLRFRVLTAILFTYSVLYAIMFGSFYPPA